MYALEVKHVLLSLTTNVFLHFQWSKVTDVFNPTHRQRCSVSAEPKAGDHCNAETHSTNKQKDPSTDQKNLPSMTYTNRKTINYCFSEMDVYLENDLFHYRLLILMGM